MIICSHPKLVQGRQVEFSKTCEISMFIYKSDDLLKCWVGARLVRLGFFRATLRPGPNKSTDDKL